VTAWGITLSVLLGLIVNEFSDLSPWLARRVIPVAAHLWAQTPEEGVAYSEEWAAVVEERPESSSSWRRRSAFSAEGLHAPSAGWRSVDALAGRRGAAAPSRQRSS